jgi:hypothetical protein
MDEFRVKPAREQANCSALSSGPGRLPQCREQFEMHGTKTGLKLPPFPQLVQLETTGYCIQPGVLQAVNCCLIYGF